MQHPATVENTPTDGCNRLFSNAMARASSMKHDLLHDPLIHADRGMLSLPGLLAAMARGEVAAFPALRPHQRPAWHMFLVQLAVLALSKAAEKTLPADEDAWRDALRGLTADFSDDAPWHLVVEDSQQPAFLQPPDPGGLTWSDVPTPDALDMLITSRNHDIKREIAREASPQDWIFALVSLQTMEGYQLKYCGIARMSSGASSRVMLTLAPVVPGTSQIDLSAWWKRDVGRLLASRTSCKGETLTWLLPWPEGHQLSLATLDPLFVEACRRVRLFSDGTRLSARKSVVLTARIDSGSGYWVDPWAPRKIADGSALTLGEKDFSYLLLKDLTLVNREGLRIWEKPELLVEKGDGTELTMAIIAEAFARGGGGKTRTDGFKSRVIPVPKAVVKKMFGSEAEDLSKAQIEAIKNVDEALRDSLRLVACDGDYEKRKAKMKSQSARAAIDKRLEPARAALQRLADALFFPALWDKLLAGSAEGRQAVHHRFVRQLADSARAEFRRAAPGILCATILRPRAEARGSATLEAGLRKIFKEMGYREHEDV